MLGNPTEFRFWKRRIETDSVTDIGEDNDDAVYMAIKAFRPMLAE